MATASLELRLLKLSVPRLRANQNIQGELSMSSTLSAVEGIVSDMERGEFASVLSGSYLASLLWETEAIETANSPDDLYKAVANQLLAFVGGEEDEESQNSRALMIMAIGVAALMSFWQANVTGPSIVFPPCHSLIVPAHRLHVFNEADCDAWARNYLMLDGCDLSGLCFASQYLVLAKIFLVDVLDGYRRLQTATWWVFRTLFAHQKILAERSPSLRAALARLKPTLLMDMKWAIDVDSKTDIIIRTVKHLECALVEYTYGKLDDGKAQIEAAKASCGLELQLTGVLGFRTVHQADPCAQMVLLANTTSTADHQACSDGVKYDTAHDEAQNEEDILMMPRINGNCPDYAGRTLHNVLSGLELAVILAECLDVKRSNPDDELRGWQMAPFVEAVDAQQSSEFMVRCCCQFLRIRWECTRSRTRERSLLMMEQLVQHIRSKASWEVQERMQCAFCVSFPTLAVLLKEYGEMMVRCGLVSDALRIFEELELWNSLIDCYCLLGKKAAAVDLIKERLKHTSEDPRLWCALGDVTLNEECYMKAWEVSNHRFAQAQRSLGRCAYNKGDYCKSIEHWDAALALNSLFPDGWFALGSAALKARDMDKALDAYTHAVQLDPDSGEAWNNIAAIHMTRKRYKEAFTAFKEAVKFKRDSWQLWENYAEVSLEVRNFGQAVEALHMVLDLSHGRRCSLDHLRKLVEELELRMDGRAAVLEHGKGNIEADRSPQEIACLSGEMENRELWKKDYIVDTTWLMDQVGKLLSRVVQDCQDGKIWGLFSQWHRLKGDLTMCAEAALKQVRSLQNSNWPHDQEAFQTLCHAALQLCEVYLIISSKTGSRKELSSAQMLLRNIMKQGESFCETTEYLAVKNLYERTQDLMKV